MLQALPNDDHDPIDARREHAAKRAAYRKVAIQAGLFTQLADHGEAALTWSPDELLELAPLEGEGGLLKGMAPAERRRWETSLEAAGRDIPYHPSWRKAYPVKVASYPYQELLNLVVKDMERWEQEYPYIFNSIQGGWQLIYDTLAGARNASLDRLLKQAHAYQKAILQRMDWLADRASDDEQAAPEPAPDNTLPASLPGWEQPTAFEWTGTKTDLGELAYALLECGILRPTDSRRRAIKSLFALFNVPLTGNTSRFVARLRERQQGAKSTGGLLDRAKEALARYLDSDLNSTKH